MYVVYLPVIKTIVDIKPLNTFLYKLYDNDAVLFTLKFILLLLTISAIFTYTSPTPIEEEEKRKYGIKGFLWAVIFFLTIFVDIIAYKKNLYTLLVVLFAISIISYLIAFFYFLKFKRTKVRDLKKDRRQLIESQFDQERELIENEYSIHFHYRYSYLGDVKESVINIVNPFRSILVGGSPGSGKSFAILEEMVRQMIKKRFTGLFYDFKTPTLTKKFYNYYLWYRDLFAIPPKFFIINFDDPEYSHRCNPLSIDNLRTIADADESTRIIMLNINRTWIEKEGDFFTDSANVFTSMLLWYLKLMTEKYNYNVCSYPHLVALSTFESSELLFLILNEYGDLKNKMKPFSDALESGALEQLAGQVASAGIALAKATSKEMNYLLTGSDFSFDLNNPINPKILSIGNNIERQDVYSAALGLIISKTMQQLNKQNKLPSFVHLDEFPTVYVRGIENTIATGRSNKISTILGFQNFSQIEDEYGDKLAAKVTKGCGSRIMGQMLDDDAEKISKTIGKQKVLTRQYTYSASDTSETQQVSMDDIAPPSVISHFSQGTFCGLIADDFKDKEENKVFLGEIIVPLELKKHEEEVELPKLYDFRPKDYEAVIDDYYMSHKKTVIQLKSILISTSYKDLIELCGNFEYSMDFNNALIKMFDMDYDSFIDFAIDNNLYLYLKEYLSDKFKLENAKIITEELSEELFQCYSSEEAEDFINSLIEAGITERNKQKILTEVTQEIYNDIYRIIAMELRDPNLDIISMVKGNPKLAKKTIPFFSRLAKSDKFTDSKTRELYNSTCMELQEQE
ncbi:hypothetical protein AS202_20165 (plasmid) [Myroides odoratimimus]|nr:hypothetical protein AS202_20165 [Myroides odoratimimus]